MDAGPDSAFRPTAAGADDTDTRVTRALLDAFAAHARRVPLPLLAAAALLGAAVRDTVPTYVLVLWLVGALLVVGVRYRVLPALPGREDLAPGRRLDIAVVLSAASGIVYSLPVYTFPALQDLERSLVTVTLLGLTAGSIGTTEGHRRVYLAYLLPVLLPLVAFWALSFVDDPGHRPLETLFAVLLVMYGLVLVSLADDAFRHFRESIISNDQLRAALAEAESASAAKTRFLAAASHDIRQPVHTLKLFTAALRRHRGLTPAAAEIVERIGFTVDAFDAQLGQLLETSRLEAGVVESHPEVVDLVELLDRVAHQFRPQAEARGLTLETRMPPDGVRALTDPVHLERLVNNLVSNAVKYTEHGGVTIELTAGGGHHRLAIVDTGIGIPAEEQEHVFEDFYQLGNPGRDRSRGQGIGLGNARRFAALLGIPMTLDSRPGAGTRFELRIPAGGTVDRPPAPEEAPPAGDLEGLEVLAVDDEREILDALSMLLDSHGCRVRTARTGAEALAACAEAAPDVVVCDFRLADGESGLDLIDRLRERVPCLPALLVTGDTTPERLREASAADVWLLHKPVDEDEFVAALLRLRPEAG